MISALGGASRQSRLINSLVDMMVYLIPIQRKAGRGEEEKREKRREEGI